MKASEVLRRYAAGERDFHGVNLSGQSFAGKNLSGGNFCNANIRGTDFSGANLVSTNFSKVTAGLSYRWFFTLALFSFILSLLAFVPAITGRVIGSTFMIQIAEGVKLDFAETRHLINIVSILITLVLIYLGIILQGLEIALTITGILLVIGTVCWLVPGDLQGITVTGVIIAWLGIATLFEIGLSAISGAFLGSVLGLNSISVIGAISGSLIGLFIARIFLLHELLQLFSGIIVIVAGSLLGSYVAWNALANNEKYALVFKMAICFSAKGGTSFRRANLTDANFTQARLKSTDLRDAKLIRTCFHKTKLLDRVRPGTSYLQHPQVRQLILTGQGQDKIFDRLDLRGINLKKAFLTDASFVSTDLSEACLQDADLSRAKLVQTQLDETDFTCATLTGAYIEDWGITNETNFRGVMCAYVYMHLPTKENPDPLRKPDNNAEVFADGEFGDFIQPIFDTLDLYHNQGVDPRAITIAYKQLAENNPDAELEIVAMEKKGRDKFLLRAKTALQADKSQLSAEYFEIYNHIKALAEQEVKVFIAEKDDRIRSLETMVVTALKSPNFYAQGDTKMSGDNIQQQGSFGIGVNKGEIKAENIAGTINEAQQQSLAETAAEIQELLEHLEKSYPTETTTGKMALAAEVMARIENNPTLTARILSTLKVGSVKAFEQFLNHPAASFVIGALEDWQKTKGS